MESVSDPEARPPSDDGRGGFFAVDRRAWARVCRLGMNPAAAYLVLARGTGGDNRTTKWSTNAIERYTGISRSRAAQAIADLEQDKAVVRDPASKRDRPKYKVAPAHEIPGCEGFPPPALSPGQQRVFDQLGDDWTVVPNGIKPKQREEHDRWHSRSPREVADELVRLGRAVLGTDVAVPPWEDALRYRAVAYDAEGAAKPDWIWLPNALVDGAAGETAPVELVRQTGSAPTLRLFVDLYAAQNLDEDGGVHFRHIRQEYERHKVRAAQGWRAGAVRRVGLRAGGQPHLGLPGRALHRAAPDRREGREGARQGCGRVLGVLDPAARPRPGGDCRALGARRHQGGRGHPPHGP